MGYLLKNRQVGQDTYGTVMPQGTTASQPPLETAREGLMRFNTTDHVMEYYNHTAFVQLVDKNTLVPLVIDNFTGDNVEVAFILTETPPSAEQILVYVGGLYQTPTTVYTVSGTTITFTTAPPLNAPISIIHNVGKIA